MRNGARPPAEWKHQAAEAPSRRQKWSREPRLTETWPMLWIGREAVHSDGQNVNVWNGFLNRLGDDHRRLGHARSVGSVALTSIEGTTLQLMLQDKYDKYNSSRRKSMDLQRRFASGLRGFMQQQEYDDIVNSSERIACQRAKIQFYFTDGYDLKIPNDLGPLTPQESRDLTDTRFSEAELTVSGLSLYGKNKLGIDLSQNEILYRERSSIIGYLRSEGFNTNRINRDWEPHAVVFDMHDHISSRTQVISYEAYGEPVLPGKMNFIATKVDSSGSNT